MTRISGILNKPVLALNGARICGIVNNVYFDKNIKNLVYFSITTDENARMLVSTSDVVSCSDAVVVDSAVVLKYAYDADLGELLSDIIGMGAYMPNGSLKGSVSDILLTQSFKVSKLLLKKSDGHNSADGAETEITPSQIAEVSDYLLLKSNAKPKSKKPKMPRPDKDYPVRIIGINSDDGTKDAAAKNGNADGKTVREQEIDSTNMSDIQNFSNSRNADGIIGTERLANDSPRTDGIVELNRDSLTSDVQNEKTYSSLLASAEKVIPEAPIALNPDSREPVLTHGAFQMLLEGDSTEYDEDAHTPTRIICDYEFLLGRTLGADLNTYLNEPIAKKGDEVTSEIVEKARRAGKLVELTLNSIKNAKQ